jgi:hypothetical protein
MLRFEDSNLDSQVTKVVLQGVLARLFAGVAELRNDDRREDAEDDHND